MDDNCFLNGNTANKRISCVWCVDSETGEEILIDTQSYRIIATKDKNGNIREVDRTGLE